MYNIMLQFFTCECDGGLVIIRRIFAITRLEELNPWWDWRAIFWKTGIREMLSHIRMLLKWKM